MSYPILCTTLTPVDLPRVNVTYYDLQKNNERRHIYDFRGKALWKIPDRKLKICFLNGTEDEKAFVRSVAYEWITDVTTRSAEMNDWIIKMSGNSLYEFITIPRSLNLGSNAKLNFDFVFDVSSEDAHIRIKFDNRCHCDIGTDSEKIPKNEPTMYIHLYECDDKKKQLAWRRNTVLHQFGHALGLVHEFEHRRLYLCDKEKVRKYPGLDDNFTNGSLTSESFIDRELVTRYRFHGLAEFEAPNGFVMIYDSIMTYPIRKDWLNNHKVLINYPMKWDSVDGLPRSRLAPFDIAWFFMRYGSCEC